MTETTGRTRGRCSGGGGHAAVVQVDGHQVAVINWREQLRRFRSAVDDRKPGTELERIVATLRKNGYEVGSSEILKTAPKGYPKDHPRIELLKQKGIVMSRSWPVGAWLGTRKAKERVVACLHVARPLNAWVERRVG